MQTLSEDSLSNYLLKSLNKMAVSNRVLPQWLVNLENGNVLCTVETRKSKNYGKNSQMKNVSVCHSNDNYSPEIKNGISSCMTNGEEVSRHNDVSKSCDNESNNELLASTSGKLVNRSGTRPEMSDCEEDLAVNSNLVNFEQKIQYKNLDMSKQELSAHACVKEENESSDETENKLVTNAGTVVESGNIEDSNSVKEPLENTASCTDVIDDASSSLLLTSVTTADSSDIDTSTNNFNEPDSCQQSSQNTNDNVTQIVRPKCKYGKQCYRKNPQHRQDFSHPGDNDYTTVDSRPECEYGLACYRKNPLHRQHYKHTQKFPRQAKRPRKKLVNNASDDDDDEDDYDLDDPFIDNASSDDYEPSASGSETDFEAEEEDTKSDDADSKLNVKETDKLKRKRRH